MVSMTTHQQHIRLHYIDDMRASYDKDVATAERTLVFDGDMPVKGERAGLDDLHLCEVAFSQFNRHDAPDQHPALDELGFRSLSVGDAVEIVEPGNSRFYLCASFGFEPIEGCRSKVTS